MRAPPQWLRFSPPLAKPPFVNPYFMCWDISAHGANKNMIENCVLTFFLWVFACVRFSLAVLLFAGLQFCSFGRAPKYRTKGCSRCWRPKFAAMKWLKCCKNQCSRSRAVSERAWTPFCVILWRWLIVAVYPVHENPFEEPSEIHTGFSEVPFRGLCACPGCPYHWHWHHCQINSPSGAKKHAKKFSIKNLGAPKTPLPGNSSCRPFSCILKGKEAPNIKNSRGQGFFWGGGLGRGGFCPNSLCLCPFLVPDSQHFHWSLTGQLDWPDSFPWFQASNLWSWSSPSVGKQPVMNYQMNLLGIHLSNRPAPHCRNFMCTKVWGYFSCSDPDLTVIYQNRLQ